MLEAVTAQTMAAARTNPWVEGDDLKMSLAIERLEDIAWGGRSKDSGLVQNLAAEKPREDG